MPCRSAVDPPAPPALHRLKTLAYHLGSDMGTDLYFHLLWSGSGRFGSQGAPGLLGACSPGWCCFPEGTTPVDGLGTHGQLRAQQGKSATNAPHPHSAAERATRRSESSFSRHGVLGLSGGLGTLAVRASGRRDSTSNMEWRPGSIGSMGMTVACGPPGSMGQAYCTISS